MSKTDNIAPGAGGAGRSEPTAEELFEAGSEALEARNLAQAHRFLHKALELKRTPDHLSQYALALAQHTGNFKAAVSLCQEAIKGEPRNPVHFLRLGMIYLAADRKKEAVRVLNLGLRVGRHPHITRLLQILGTREKPVLSFLSRSNPVNKYLGKIRSSLGKKG